MCKIPLERLKSYYNNVKKHKECFNKRKDFKVMKRIIFYATCIVAVCQTLIVPVVACNLISF